MKLKCDILLSTYAYTFNLCRYTENTAGQNEWCNNYVIKDNTIYMAGTSAWSVL